MEEPESSRHRTGEPPETPVHGGRRRYFCFSIPCLDRPGVSSSASAAGSTTWWQKIRAAEIGDGGGGGPSSLWARGVGTLRRIREWSEIVAGPRWKTFIRRFNRNRSGSGGRNANIQYDPLSYAMNFDEGPGQNGPFGDEGDDGYYYGSRNFSSRYAKGSMDVGKDGPTFV